VGALTYAGRDPNAHLAVWQAATIGAPVSYARATYHAVHAFWIVGTRPDGIRRFVRFDWRPVAGVLNTPEDDPPKDVYLKQELAKRLEGDPVRFTLMMTIGETGDNYNDPSRPWPPHRTRVVMGELSLDTLADDTLIESMSFNPWLLTKGIEPTDDPVLAARRDAYQVSSGRRIGAVACPFSRSSTHGET
jgi:catalase